MFSITKLAQCKNQVQESRGHSTVQLTNMAGAALSDTLCQCKCQRIHFCCDRNTKHVLEACKAEGPKAPPPHPHMDSSSFRLQLTSVQEWCDALAAQYI